MQPATGKRSVWVGYDPRELVAHQVARRSVEKNFKGAVRSLNLKHLREFYWRSLERRGTQIWDPISDAPMSTEFAISRFLVPHLVKEGLSLFVDGDVLVRRNLDLLFDLCGDDQALYCVKHDFSPGGRTKKLGQAQTAYERKCWSSVMVFNCDHPSNKRLTLEMINTLPGRDLHRFCWLKDEEIGGLPEEWNWLVGHSKADLEPAVVHYTEGTPDLQGHERDPYAEEWKDHLYKKLPGRLELQVWP